MLYPQRPRIEKKPLQMINADDSVNESTIVQPMVLPERADFVYTYDPDTILAARPADCPIALATAETPKGKIMMLTHFSWEVIADGSAEKMFEHYAALGVDMESVRLYLTPGGQAESFPYTNYDKDPRELFNNHAGLFANVRPNSENPEKYDFEVDAPYFAYTELIRLGLKPEQIYVDTSDTARPDSGYSSHGRAMRSRGTSNEEMNIRDIIIAKMNPVLQNPERYAPAEILRDITPLVVEYTDMGGELQQGTIEIDKEVAQDVADFFHLAMTTRFPIERVVRSSDREFGWDDDKLMAANTTSGFNYRLIKDTDRPSRHGLGRAFDVNTALNPFIRYKDGEVFIDPPGGTHNPNVPGTLHATHPLVLFMKRRGWTWGGDWTPESGRIDYQHFEKP